jgi:threonine/homoserine/homoserine lactone efflux protein
MNIEFLLSFLGASILLTLMPGPDNIFVLTESLTKGQRYGIAISVGLSLGVLVHTTAAATGLSIVLYNSDIAFCIVKYLGAAYLFYIAVQASREKREIIDLSIGAKDDYHFRKLVRKGFLMNVLNPKVSLFFIAFLPQFVSKAGIDIVYQMFVLGIIFMIQALIIFTVLAALSARISHYLSNNTFWKITKWVKVIILSALCILLIVSEK